MKSLTSVAHPPTSSKIGISGDFRMSWKAETAEPASEEVSQYSYYMVHWENQPTVNLTLLEPPSTLK